MVRQEGERRTWQTAVKLSAGEHEFRYRIGDHWFNDASADRYVSNGLGSDNSVVIVESDAERVTRRRGGSAGTGPTVHREEPPGS